MLFRVESVSLLFFFVVVSISCVVCRNLQMDFSPGKELLHTKLDLEAMQEVTRLLQNENTRLRQVLHDAQADHAVQLRELVDGKTSLETTVAEMRVELEHSRSERVRLEAELVEAVGERRRQAQLVQDVRRQVDGRISKLMEELHRRDEEVHKLEYQNRERERALEKLQLLENTLAQKDEQISKLREQVGSLQADVAAGLQESAVAKAELRVLRERSIAQDTQSHSVTGEVAQVLPLYRQWSTTVERSLIEMEDVLEALCDEVIDTEYYLLYDCENTAALPDRRRLITLKKIDRDRLAAQQQLLAQVAATNDNDVVALSVQAIRTSCDSSRYTMGKCSSAASQLRDLVASLRAKVVKANTSRQSPTTVQHQQHATAVRRAAEESELVDTLKSELVNARQTMKQLRDTTAALETKCSDLSHSQTELNSKFASESAALKQCEHELQRRVAECDSLRKLLGTADNESNRLREEIHQLRLATRTEREEAALSSREVESKSQVALRTLQDDFERKYTATKRELEDRLKRSEDDVSRLKQELADFSQREEKMRSVLEESRQKRLALKRQREDLLEECQEARSSAAIQAKELRAVQEMNKSLTQELERAKMALELEVRHQENATVSAAADASLFREWKQHHLQTSHHGSSTDTSNQRQNRVVLMVQKPGRR